MKPTPRCPPRSRGRSTPRRVNVNTGGPSMNDRSDSGERSARSPFVRRSFLGGALAAGAAGAALGHLVDGAAPAAGTVAADGRRDGTGSFVFHGLHQAGI